MVTRNMDTPRTIGGNSLRASLTLQKQNFLTGNGTNSNHKGKVLADRSGHSSKSSLQKNGNESNHGEETIVFVEGNNLSDGSSSSDESEFE